MPPLYITTAYFLLGSVYVLRLIVRYFYPTNATLRRALLYFLIMYSLISLIGAARGYVRWNSLLQHGVAVEAEIIHAGACGHADVYEQGKFGRMMKRIMLVDLSGTAPGYNPFRFTHAPGMHCLIYRFPVESRMLYAGQQGGAGAIVQKEGISTVRVRYDPNYLNNNWIEAYIPGTMEYSTYYMVTSGLALMEGVLSFFFWHRRHRLPYL